MNKETLYNMANEKGQKQDCTFQRFHNPKHYKHQDLHKRFSLIMKNIVGPKILDIGCWPGLTCYLASQRDDIKEIHGVDLQIAIIKQARENVKSNKVTFHHGFFDELNFELESFNTIVFGEVLEHVCSVNKTLAEAYPLLKPGGRVIITCPYKGKLSRLHVRTITKDFMKNRIEKYFKLEKMEILKYSKFKPGMFCLGIKNK